MYISYVYTHAPAQSGFWPLGLTNSPSPLVTHARLSLDPIILTEHLLQALFQVLQTQKHASQTDNLPLLGFCSYERAV